MYQIVFIFEIKKSSAIGLHNISMDTIGLEIPSRTHFKQKYIKTIKNRLNQIETIFSWYVSILVVKISIY